jgi:zinc protease
MIATATPIAKALNNPVIHRLANGLTIIAEQIPVNAVNLNLWLWSLIRLTAWLTSWSI